MGQENVRGRAGADGAVPTPEPPELSSESGGPARLLWGGDSPPEWASYLPAVCCRCWYWSGGVCGHWRILTHSLDVCDVGTYAERPPSVILGERGPPR